MARITKKQLKEDKLLSATEKISLFLNQYWGHIVAGVVAIAVVIAVIVLYGNYITGRNEKVVRSFNEAKDIFNKAEAALGIEEDAESVTGQYEEARAKFQATSQKNGHRDTISKALFYSAKCSYLLGEYSEAISGFQNFADKYPKSMLAIHVQRAIGNCYEQLGGDENLRKAIQQYDIVLKAPETDATLDAIMDKGRCYEKLGEWDKAIALYKSIADRYKQNVELAVQTKSKELIQTAKDVMAKYDAIPGGGQESPDFTKFMDEANAFAGKEQWFEALKAYDKAIVSQKKLWNEKTSEEYSTAVQDASKALKDYNGVSLGVISAVAAGRKLAKKGDWDTASRYYTRVTTPDSLPGGELFEKVQFRTYWINSIEKPSTNIQ